MDGQRKGEREINRLSVQQWLRSAIPDSRPRTSPIGFLFLKLPPPPCAVLLVYYPRSVSHWSQRVLLQLDVLMCLLVSRLVGVMLPIPNCRKLSALCDNTSNPISFLVSGIFLCGLQCFQYHWCACFVVILIILY